MIKPCFTFLVLVVLFSGCYYDVESELYGTVTCEVPDIVSFSTDVQPIILTNCAISGCHVAGGVGPGEYQDYTGLKVAVDAGTFEQRVIVQRDMPPTGALPDCDLLLLEKWIAQGAPNN